MRTINVTLSDDEYSEVQRRKGSKTHKKVFMDGLNIDYTPPKTGRPSKAFDAAEHERKMREIHLAKIAEYNRQHQAEVDEARRILGIDGKVGSVSGFLIKDKIKKRL